MTEPQVTQHSDGRWYVARFNGALACDEDDEWVYLRTDATWHSHMDPDGTMEDGGTYCETQGKAEGMLASAAIAKATGPGRTAHSRADLWTRYEGQEALPHKIALPQKLQSCLKRPD